MRKKFTIIALTVCLFCLLTSTVYAARKITVIVGGEELESDVPATIIDDRVMLPVRALFENLGAEVEYDENGDIPVVIATKDDITVKFTVGMNLMSVNGVVYTIAVPATIVDNRLLVPLRSCANAFNLEIDWNPVTYTARVKKEVLLVEMYTDDDGVYHKFTYDNNGNCVYYENSDGEWEK